MSDEVSAGQAVSDWALVRFPRKFASNKFRDGSWVDEPRKLPKWRALLHQISEFLN